MHDLSQLEVVVIAEVVVDDSEETLLWKSLPCVLGSSASLSLKIVI